MTFPVQLLAHEGHHNQNHRKINRQQGCADVIGDQSENRRRNERTQIGTGHLDTDDGPMDARAVIFAAGAKPRPLGVDREEELVGQGISYCALCDGAQSLTPAQFDELNHRIQKVREAIL